MNDARYHQYRLEDQLNARSRRNRLERIEAEAIRLCEEFVRLHRCNLALSFGKDSMTCLHLLHVAGRLADLPLVMWNASGVETPDTLAFRDYVVATYELDNFRETWPDPEVLERTVRMIDLHARHPTREFVYECLERPRWRLMDEFEIDGTILGLRGQESNGRRIHIALNGTEYWNRREKAAILLPIAHWSLADVFAYAALRNVPMHPIYHTMTNAGVPRDKVRLNTPLSVICASRGQLLYLRRLYPDIFRWYSERVPAIRDLA